MHSITRQQSATECFQSFGLRFTIANVPLSVFRSLGWWILDACVDGYACVFVCVSVFKGKKLNCVGPIQVVAFEMNTGMNEQQEQQQQQHPHSNETTNNLCVCVSDVRTFYYYYFCLIQAFVIFCLAYTIRILPFDVPIFLVQNMQQAPNIQT